MAAGVVLRQLFCRAAGCGAMFFLCLSCYRGQTYCSQPCRQKSRREQLRQANRRYQQSWEARLDHRDRQREYRLRRGGRVTDQSSLAPDSCGRINRALVPVSTQPAFSESDALHQRSWREGFHRLFCILCGRWGQFIEIFRSRR
jgi:hypothetical protein